MTALRNHPREGDAVIAADFSMQGISWAPRDRVIVRKSLEEPDALDGFAYERSEPVQYRSLEHVAADSLCLIDGSSFERTGLDVFGSGDIPPEEFARRRKLSENFSYDDLKDLDPRMLEQPPAGSEEGSGFMTRVKKQLGGGAKSPEDRIGPLFWAQPSEERPDDCFEKQAGGVWISLPRDFVGQSWYTPMGPPPTSPTEPASASTSAGSGSGYGIPLGAPVFVHGTFAFDGSGSLIAVNPTIVAGQSRDEFIATRRGAADSANRLGLACLGLSGAMAAGAVFTAVRAAAAAQQDK